VQILADGRLVVDFTSEEDVLVISQDGKMLHLYRKPWNQEAYPREQFGYAEMPSRLSARYEYGRRFMSLVRSKTPQVVLVADTLKAFLMCNPAPHDFQIRYNMGLRVDYFPSREAMVLRRTDGSERRIEGLSIEQITPTQDRLVVSECLTRYRQCYETALRIAGKRECHPFPYVIRESATHIGEITAPQISTLISTSMASMSSRIPSADRSFEYAYKTYLPNVGWCLASPAEQFLLLFTDGQTVLIDGRRNRVAFHDRQQEGSQAWMDIDQQLPPELKKKLIHFPQFVNLLKNGNGHSFVS
jgi:hypothetical protein